MFEHRIIDNFLADETFAELSSLPFDYVEPTKREITTVRATPRSAGPGSHPLMDAHHDQMMQLLEELAPEKVALYDHSDIHTVITGKDYKFQIHNDFYEKILSVVVYLAPEKNRGTLMYSNKAGADEEEVEWKQNRAMIFSREENVTWHAYGGDGISNRLVLVYNLKSKL